MERLVKVVNSGELTQDSPCEHLVNRVQQQHTGERKLRVYKMRREESLRQAENCNIFFIGENSFRDDFPPFFGVTGTLNWSPTVRFERRPIFSSATLQTIRPIYN
jgi:hypothetical protein